MATVSPTSEALSDRGPASGVMTAKDVLAVIGSLKLTVALFAASLIIVLVGTLAQDEMNMQDVKLRYFTSWVAWMHIDDFFPQAFFPHSSEFPGIVPFPGGALIGALLMLNLIASKATRFKVSASGGRLAGGILFCLLGFAVAGLMVASGNSSDGLQGAPPITYPTLWRLVQFAGVASAIGMIAFTMNISNRAIKFMGFLFAAALAGAVFYTLFTGASIGDPGLRIVWQLAKGMGAGLILLVGCLMIFGRQGGNLLLHFGVALLMFGQFAFGDRQMEQRISLVEGASTNSLINLDKVELAFIESIDDEDIVTAIPGSKIAASVEAGELISDDTLPVDVRVVEYFENSDLIDPVPGNPATTGVGLERQAKLARKKGGTESEINVAAAYVELLDKESGEPLGTHLVSQMLSDRATLLPDGSTQDFYDSIKVGDKEYKIGLKYHREVKPYWVHLEDVQRRNYSGTETPRDYSSYIRIIDPETGEDRRERVWMNNPLRYRGETFFQSSYTPLPGGKEMTGLQVVRNSGWLIPYVACSIIALGMLAHFTGTLKRFVGKRERELNRELAELSEEERRKRLSFKSGWFAMAVAALIGFVMLVPWSAVMQTMRPAVRDQSFDLHTAGKIPTQFGGRTMPLDTFARLTLKSLSNRESLSIEEAPGKIKERVQGRSLSAIQWLMEVAADTDELRFLPMFRVDSEEVRSQLKLDRRESKLYSLDELLAEWDKANPLIVAARAKDVAAQSFKEKKLLELDRRTRQYLMTAEAFQLPSPRAFPKESLPEGVTEEMVTNFIYSELQRRMESLKQMPTARIVPPSSEVVAASVKDPDWTAFAPAFFDDAAAGPAADKSKTLPSEPFSQMISSYASEKLDFEGFNDAVDSQLEFAKSYAIPGYKPSKVSLERWMESNSPNFRASVLYYFAMVLGLIYFAIGKTSFRNAIWGILLVAFLIHTIGMVSRIYITGRAPVINIYSSAVFIGWAGVLFGLIIDRIFRLGFGNILAATSGVLSLLVARGLSLNTGDTMPVLQAVLDTQFWLATHVISVSLGYVATMVAGILGIIYLVVTWAGLKETSGKSVYRMVYGATCFGILFSTVGTILGGLWADDSWGRFWGWDPKENGALLIVIWNALMLHARWDGMVKSYGFSILAIGGNIVTAWSWFGTNELGIGLHSYGFTQGVLMWLTIFMAVQAAFILAGLIFRNSGGGGGKASMG